MPYALGIDLGSGRTTAAISRNDHGRWTEPRVVPLDGEQWVASVLHLTDTDTVEVGSQALRKVAARADRMTRDFVDRIGDEIPITLGGRPYPAESLTAALVGWVVDAVEAAERAPASQLVVTHPAGWGAHRRAVLLGALREVDLPELTLLPRPVAAAESYAATERVEVGEEIAVHSLGAGRFESAVLRRGSFGFEPLAHASSLEVLGGDLFDDLLADHVLATLGEDLDSRALARLRVACVTARERLSSELAVTVPAPAGSARGTVAVNRSDLEELIRPAVESTVRSLQRTIQAAGTSPGALRAVVLVGGCGRIPLVTELVSAGVRVRVAAAPAPENAVARGAATAATRVAKPTVRARALAVRPKPMAPAAVTHTDLMRFDDVADEEDDDIGPPPPRPPVEITPLEPPRKLLTRLVARARRGGDEDDELDRLRDDLDADDLRDLDPEPDDFGAGAEIPNARRDIDIDDIDDDNDGIDDEPDRDRPPRRARRSDADLDPPPRRTHRPERRPAAVLREDPYGTPDRDDLPEVEVEPSRRRHLTDDSEFNRSLSRHPGRRGGFR